MQDNQNKSASVDEVQSAREQKNSRGGVGACLL
jgi:hypothetical protein